VGVEPTGDTARCRPPVLKTGTITGPHALPFFKLSKWILAGRGGPAMLLDRKKELYVIRFE